MADFASTLMVSSDTPSLTEIFLSESISLDSNRWQSRATRLATQQQRALSKPSLIGSRRSPSNAEKERFLPTSNQ